MKLIGKGDVFGVYKVLDTDSQYTIRGGKRYKCRCMVCNEIKKYSEWFLRNTASKIPQCLCGKEHRIIDIQRDFNYVNKNYGKINLCGFCRNIFKCAKYTRNSIDKRYMIDWSIAKVNSNRRKRNLILVYDCKKFNFDWGGFL